MAEIGTDTVTIVNRDYARLQLSAARVEAVRVELGQLATAIERVRGAADFDSEPGDFVAALRVPLRKRADG